PGQGRQIGKCCDPADNCQRGEDTNEFLHPIPAFVPILPISRPSFFARARIPCRSPPLHPVSPADFPTVRRDSPASPRVRRWCFPIPVIGQSFFFPLSRPRFFPFWRCPLFPLPAPP